MSTYCANRHWKTVEYNIDFKQSLETYVYYVYRKLIAACSVSISAPNLKQCKHMTKLSTHAQDNTPIASFRKAARNKPTKELNLL